MEETLLSQMMGASSLYLINDTGAHIINCRGIVVREDTVISAWSVNGPDNQAMDMVAYNNLGGKTLLVTDPVIWIPNGKTSRSITLASGSVWAIR